MGPLCCCFHVPDVEENDESNSSNHGNCIGLKCFIQNLTNKHATPSIQVATSSSSMVTPNNTQFDTGTHLPNDVNPHLQPEPPRRSNVQISPEISSRVDKQDGSYSKEEPKGWHSKSSAKVLMGNVESGVGYLYSASDDEDICPTCLEEYTPENPKIITKCRHQYHLSCIYEWMERSEKCPICGKLMEFDETS